jgi:hypothetical protein
LVQYSWFAVGRQNRPEVYRIDLRPATDRPSGTRLARALRGRPPRNAPERDTMFGLGIVGVILLIIIVLWLLGVIG